MDLKQSVFIILILVFCLTSFGFNVYFALTILTIQGDVRFIEIQNELSAVERNNFQKEINQLKNVTKVQKFLLRQYGINIKEDFVKESEKANYLSWPSQKNGKIRDKDEIFTLPMERTKRSDTPNPCKRRRKSCRRGKKGEKGDMGFPGIRGPIGPAGEKGDRGLPGHPPVEVTNKTIAIHLDGSNVPERVEPNQYFRGWKLTTKTSNIGFENGKIKINKDGYYFVYAQVKHSIPDVQLKSRLTSGVRGHRIQSEGKILSKSVRFYEFSATHGIKRMIGTELTVAVSFFKAGNSIEVVLLNSGERTLNPGLSYFGAYKI